MDSPCDDFRCYNGGNCVVDPTLPDGAECDCPEGFDGEHCEYRMFQIFTLLPILF